MRPKPPIKPVDRAKFQANKAMLDPDFNLWVKELTLAGYDPIVELDIRAGRPGYTIFTLFLGDDYGDLVSIGTFQGRFEVWWAKHMTVGRPEVLRKAHKVAHACATIQEAIEIASEVIRNGDYEAEGVESP